MSKSIFRNELHQKIFEKDGYVSFPFLEMEDVERLKALYYRLNIPDVLKTGLHSTLSYAKKEQRKLMHEVIMEVINEPLKNHLRGRSVLIASFLSKTKKDSGLVCCHQDFTMCDEDRETSIFAWIPLMDVDMDSGALGFIPGSHRFFSYKRVFPFPIARTPVEVHKRKLTAYTKILPMKASEIVFFNTKTIHGSFTNFSGEDRIAVNLSIRPADQEPYFYYLKPNSNQSIIIKYKLDCSFFNKYSGLDLYQLYQSDKIIEDYPILEEEDYSYEKLSWDEMRKILKDAGVEKDKDKEEIIRAYFSMSPAEVF